MEGEIRRPRRGRLAPIAPLSDSPEHAALFYRDDAEYLDGVAGFLRTAVDAGDAAVAAVPPARLSLLRAELGDGVELLDMTRLGRNPGRIIPAVHDMLERHRGRRLHYVGEPIWAGRAPEEICEATRHEALINLAWPDAPISVLCPYDAVGLDDAVLADAKRTHPHVVHGRGTHLEPSRAYAGAAFPEHCDRPLPDPPPHATSLRFAAGDLERVRVTVSAQAAAAGMSRTRAADLLMAVSELAANSVRHGHGRGELRIWREDGRVSCDVRDRGRIADPLAGRRLPAPGSPGGRGLWLVHQVCDLVEVRSGADGTAVRIHTSVR